MPTIDDFTRPRELIPPLIDDMGRAIREWVDDRYMPMRRKIDEDWAEHKLVKPLLKEIMVDFGLNRTVWPVDVGGLDISSLGTTGVSTIRIFEELGRADSGFGRRTGYSKKDNRFFLFRQWISQGLAGYF